MSTTGTETRTDNIFIIVTPDNWENIEPKLKVPGAVYEGSALDKNDGFIHASYGEKEHLFPVLDQFFSGVADVVILTIDLNRSEEGKKLMAEGKLQFDHVKIEGWMESDFPHFYTPLPLSCVAEVRKRTELDHPWKPLPPRAAPFYKVLFTEEWEAAKGNPTFAGTALDQNDGFLHFSVEEELELTLDLYYTGREDVVILMVDLSASEEGRAILASETDFRYDWVKCRGAYFPHVYNHPLPLNTVKTVQTRAEVNSSVTKRSFPK